MTGKQNRLVLSITDTKYKQNRQSWNETNKDATMAMPSPIPGGVAVRTPDQEMVCTFQMGTALANCSQETLGMGVNTKYTVKFHMFSYQI